MSKPLPTKETLIRSSWLTELRRQGHRQCEGEFIAGTKVCAMGLLAEVVFPRLDARRLRRELDAMAEVTSELGVFAGLSEEQAETVVNMNDGTYEDRGWRKQTFAEIADVVESWFKPE